MTIQNKTIQEKSQLKSHSNITTEQDIVQFLREHPDFFEQRPDLLITMRLPHESGTAVSLIERQVSILREQKEDARAKLHALIEVAEQNDKLSQRFNALILTLIDTQSFGQVIDFIQQRLVTDFDAYRVSIRVLKGAPLSHELIPESASQDTYNMALFDKVIENRIPVCGCLPMDQLEQLFNDDYEKIRSAALIPLIKDSKSDCLGLLAIGSIEKDRFHADMGTLFLSHLSMVLTRVIEKHLAQTV